VLWTCNVLGEGWDYPGLRCVMLARPTLSIARYLQQVARCMRPGSDPVVLDLWGAFKIHDMPWADFEWSLDGRVRKSLWKSERSATGEVTWLPPIEVDGVLVRADAPVRTPCAECGKPSTRSSVRMARWRGGKSYCTEHAGGPTKKLFSPCAVCSRPATNSSSKRAKSRGCKAYCAKHARGSLRKMPLLICSMCTKPATRQSSTRVRRGEGKAFCTKHIGGSKKKFPLLKCFVCSKPARRSSSCSARLGKNKPYCAKHKGGGLKKKTVRR
jgi:hypothetical protein